MILYFTEEFSIDVGKKLSFLPSYDDELKNFFGDKSYGEDLEVLYICLLCMSANFEKFFKPRRTKYQKERSIYIHQGVEVERESNSLSYELRLNYQEYMEASLIKPLLARDVLTSLDIILSVKKIKHFDLVAFRNDLAHFFKLNGWTE